MEKICGTADVPAGTMKEFSIKGKRILVANVEGKFYAMDALCPHMRAQLANGKMEGAIITCPHHGARFDVTSGKMVRNVQGLMGKLGGKAKDTGSYPASVSGDSVVVNV